MDLSDWTQICVLYVTSVLYVQISCWLFRNIYVSLFEKELEAPNKTKFNHKLKYYTFIAHTKNC